MKFKCEHNWELDELFQTEMRASFRCTLCGRVEDTPSNDITYRLAMRAQIRRNATTRKSVQEGANDRLSDLLEEAAEEIENLRRWKEAIIGELMTCHIFSGQHMNNPATALHDAIIWNIQTALDPAVSEDARKLIQRGRDESIS